MYNVKGLTKIYDKSNKKVTALDDVNLEVADGDMLTIQGPTGGGKSTLLQLLGGLDRATAGSVWLEGDDLSTLSEGQVTKVRAEKIGFVFQSFNLIPTLNALENVEMALVPLGLSTTVRRERSIKALAEVGLEDRPTHFPSELSGGQQQRVAIARAIVKEPRVLLADEPTGNLDEQMRDEIVAVLESMWKEKGLTLIVVTHDSYIAKRAPKTALIRKGRVEVRENA